MYIPDMLALTKYTRLPPRLAEMFPNQQPHDKYASDERLNAILSVLKGRDLGHVVDLGGNSGFFCLSLVDAGIAKSADIYDLSGPAIAAGREMARIMELDGKISLHEQAVDLQFLNSLGRTDTMVCLNLLHHAGASFDKQAVEVMGWDVYALEWLAAMRSKSRIGIFGVSFEPRKPVNWDEPHSGRPAALGRIAEGAGWSTFYDANVEDLCTLGIEAANGRYTKGGVLLVSERDPTLLRRLGKRAARLTGLQFLRPKQQSKLSRYHLYIFE